MKDFFEAKSVVIVGVSASPDNMGRAIIYNLVRYQYSGIVYAVGPKGGSFLGFKIYPSVLDIPEPTDLAVILVPAKFVPEVLRQCGEKGIRRVVVESAGFTELGQDRAGLEQEVLGILRNYDMRLIGPNCVGIINRHTGLAVPFMPIEPLAPPGNIAVIAQSGGVGGSLLNMFGGEKLGYSIFASIGNKLNVTECDLVDYCIATDHTKTIFLYLEGISDGRRLMEQAMRAKKPIVLHKSNRTEAGKSIARSHSASLSSDDTVVDAACCQAGIIRVQDQTEALTVLKGFSLPIPKGPKLAVISRSGGHAVVAADAAEEYGFQLVPFPEKIIKMAEDRARAGVVRFQNPLDLGDVFDLRLYLMLAEEVMKDPIFDALLFVHHYQGALDGGHSRSLVKELDAMSKRYDKPLAFCLFTSPEEYLANRRATDFPIFTDPRHAIRALAATAKWATFQPIPFANEPPGGLNRSQALETLEHAPRGLLGPAESALILEAYGIRLVPWRIASTEEETILMAEELGFPLVMKTASPKVIHKTEAGAIVLNIENVDDVRRAYMKLSKFDRRVLLQRMVRGDGLEWIAGGRQVDQFGPVVLTGLGGITVEVIGDRAIRVAPITREEAKRMVDETKGAKLLEPFRGKKAKDRDALEDLIVRLSWLLYDIPRIGEIDLNPLWITDEGVVALDWRIIVFREEGVLGE
ncbi:MAG: acetate--CoA ligase family protein [Syntrophobacterales bacterium]|nr:acetate--CoA ligase family protein [Syntrophobacterales bacterium]